MSSEPGRPEFRRKVYGRRRGKALRASQQHLMTTLLPQIQVPQIGPDFSGTKLDLAALFPAVAQFWLEIGFGGGEHLVHQASNNPQVGLIGCEPYLNGVAMALGKIAAAGVTNIRLHPADARDLLDALPDAVLERVFLLYPDPWPKARHHRRRFMNPDNLVALARVMKPGAVLRVATDIPDYAEHALAAAAQSPDFVCITPDDDIHRPWEDWPGTRYEAKALRAGRRPHYMAFRRSDL